MSTKTYLVTEYSVSIKTGPEQRWHCPVGWGPYPTRSEAERARKQADAQWMATRLIETTERREMTPVEAARLERSGVTITALGSARG